MKVVILAGGLPSIIGEENEKVAKPMVRIGERPILWHIMKMYSHYGFNDFIICTGYKAEDIKDYFMNYYMYRSDVTVHLKTNEVEIHHKVTEPWKVTIVDTGMEATTANRIYQVQKLLKEDFIVAFGDCISNLDVSNMVKVHQQGGKIMTLALARPTGRNAIVATATDGTMLTYQEAAQQVNDAWANANMMVVSPQIFAEVGDWKNRFETDVVEQLIEQRQVFTYHHNGFWLPIETVRDRDQVQKMWNEGNVPWRVWEDG